MNAYERMIVRRAAEMPVAPKKAKYAPCPLDAQRAADEREMERLAVMAAYRTAAAEREKQQEGR